MRPNWRQSKLKILETTDQHGTNSGTDTQEGNATMAQHRRYWKHKYFRLKDGQRLAFRGKGSVRVKLPKRMCVWVEPKT